MHRLRRRSPRALDKRRKVAVILGSGAGGLRDALEDAEAEGYGALGLPTTSVVGHEGELIVGQLGGKKVAMLAGRIHAYEGRSMEESVRAVRAMAAWGVEVLLDDQRGRVVAYRTSPG